MKALLIKKLFYIKFKKVLYSTDRRKSKFIRERMFGKLLFDRNSEPSIAYVRELHLDCERLSGVDFVVLSDFVGNNAFVSTAFANKMQSKQLKSVDYISVDDYHRAEIYKSRDLEQEYGSKIGEIPTFKPT